MSLALAPIAGMQAVTAGQMQAADGYARESGVSEEQLVRAAGLAVAELAQHLAPNGRWLAVAGKGNNGADALSAAANLRARGVGAVDFRVFTDPIDQLRYELSQADWIIDGILGTSLRGTPQGLPAQAIAALNDAGLPVLAVDLPSGLDPDSGGAVGLVVRAAVTLTLALPKTGLARDEARRYTGPVLVAGIGLPAEALIRAGVINPRLLPAGLIAEWSPPGD